MIGDDFTCRETCSGCPTSQREALESLYRSTDGGNWDNNNNWMLPGSICDWKGITCDYKGRVTGIVLNFNNLSGNIPESIADLSPSFRVLSLAGNNLNGTIPELLEIWRI